MSNPFDRAFDKPAANSLMTPAAQSVQASLYGRLKKKHGNNSGMLGWLLVRAAQPDHKQHAYAIEKLNDQTVADLAALLDVAEATLNAPVIQGRPDAKSLAIDIVVALRRTRAKVRDADNEPKVFTPEEQAEFDALLDAKDKGPRIKELLAVADERFKARGQ